MADILLRGLVSYAPGAPPASSQNRSVGSLIAGPDAQDGGDFQITGTVAIDGSPDIMVARRVLLLDRRNCRVVRETWSQDGTGIYTFDGIRSGPFTVIAFDYNNVYNAVVADNVFGDPA